MIRVARIAAAMFLLAGCAHAPACEAIAGEVERLECGAATGNKLAQLELGIRYEAGDGVARDLLRAERLYARAAQTRQRSAWVYSPAVGRERLGRLIPLGANPSEPGLSEARRRLDALRQARGSGR